MSTYGEVLRAPGVARVITAQLTARFPSGMYSLGFLLHLERVHDSYAAAGLVLAALSVGQAAAGPLTTRWMGRFGTRNVLWVTLSAASLAVLAIALLPVPLAVHAALGLVAGLSMPPILPAARTLYPKMVPQRQLAPLFSLDASLQEIIWVLGPVIATFLAAGVGTAQTLVVAVIIQIGGGLWFILSPEVGKLRIPRSDRKLGRVLQKKPVLLTVVTGMLVIGAFAAVEAGVVAVYGHDSPLSGVVLAVSAIGSLIGGFSLGHRPITRWSLGIRCAIMAVGFVAACFVSGTLGLSAALFIAGLGCAPALSAMSSIIAGTVKFSDTPEAYGWTGSGQLIGAALGSAVAGTLIDAHGSIGGMWIATALALTSVLVAVVFRRHQPDLRGGIEAPPETRPVELPR